MPREITLKMVLPEGCEPLGGREEFEERFRRCSEACLVHIEIDGEPVCSQVPSLCVYHCVEGRFAEAFRELLREVDRCLEYAKRPRRERRLGASR